MQVLPLDRQDHSKDNGLPPNGGVNSDSSSGEKTLAGKAIGTVWDFVAGAPVSQEAKAERAHEADQYAEIAADTFAAIPKFKGSVGGLARGVLLADISGTKSSGDWTIDFATNVAEGVLLNKAGKLALGDGALTKIVSNKLGGGLASELTMHGLSGAAFGAVKSGFNIDAARDQQGNFSTSKYFENLAVNTSVGGLIGMPAGAIGSRFGKVVSSRLGTSAESSLLGHTLKQTITAGSSGFAGGAVFGGVESLKEAKSLSDVLAGTLKGGTIGFFTAGATGAFEPRIRTSSTISLGKNVGEPISAQLFESHPHFEIHRMIESSPAGPRASGDKSQRDRRLDQLHGEGEEQFSTKRDLTKERELPVVRETPVFTYENLAFKPKEVLIKDFESKLKLVGTEERTVRRMPDDAPKTHTELLAQIEAIKAEAGKFDFTEYYHKMTVPEVVTVNVYEVPGLPMKIVVPTEYANRLAEVRDLRRVMEMPSPYDNVSPRDKFAISAQLNAGDATVLAPFLSPAEISKSVPVIQAGLALTKHPLGFRALPEDMVPILQSLPNPNLIKELVLSDQPDFSNAYYSHKYGQPNFRAAADVSHAGVVTHYEANRGNNLLEHTYHEWAHLTKWASPELSKLFDMATIVDKVSTNVDYAASRAARVDDLAHPNVEKNTIYFSREHASRTPDENWAVAKGELFMSPDPDGLWEFAHQAPVRALALSTALEASFIQRKNAPRTEQDNVLLERIKMVDQVSRPLAIQALSEHLQSGSPEQRYTAAKMLSLYGDATAIGALRKAAQDPKNQVSPQWDDFKGFVNPNAENPTARRDQPNTVASMAVDAMVKLGGETPTQRAQFALNEAMANPLLRPLIVGHWRLYDARNPDYSQFLNYYDKPSHLNPMQKLIETRLASDPTGRKMALDEILRLTEGDSRAQTGYLTRNYEFVPGLRVDVLNRFELMLNRGSMTATDRLRAKEFFDRQPREAMSPQIAKQVDALVERMATEKKVEDALSALNRPGQNHIENMRELANMRDVRAIRPLLEHAVGNNADNKAEALRALQKFSPAIVKFYAQTFRRENLANQALAKRLEQLISSHSYVAPGTGLAAGINFGN
ncbi:hypothetical protein BH11CYA1_BH11CYA1_29840 [soil metagenome]